MQSTKQKAIQRSRRRARIRAKVYGTSRKPRLSVYKSNNYVYGQLIDDERAHTIAAALSRTAEGATDTERAYNAGKALAEAAVQDGVQTVVFDRGGFVYTGRVQAFADGAREGGLQF